MSDSKAPQEPTMEEILASIRRIISEDSPAPGAPPAAAAEQEPEPPPPPPPPPAVKPPPAFSEPASKAEVLELTEELKDDGSVVPVAPPPPEPPPPPPRMAPPPPPPPPLASDFDDIDLVSPPVAHQAAVHLGSLASAVSATRSVPIGNGAQTLEELIRELLRPMLKQWLDANLATIVQRAVDREVVKLSTRADEDRFR